ncbi:M48 family metalloprotease [Vibrio sp. DBSS07]|uniref:M48 family metalloprotease n=1 Tax=Vibrio paucivorans TaxID=2829489 RepID=A0A9X3CIK1_9VIBR|nr:M48 family metalloprotease [Vibrio paucivorans]MCW8335435.1 M48 family metalloprotease [Vibrio paucivorans]
MQAWKSFSAITVLAGLVACSSSPTGRNQLILFSDQDMSSLGAQSFEEMKKELKISKDKKVNAYVQCVAKSITDNVPKQSSFKEWEVVVFDSDQVNAFALPGGKIGVYTGLLDVAVNQDQLATVLGHEVAHVLADHSNERLSQSQLANNSNTPFIGNEKGNIAIIKFFDYQCSYCGIMSEHIQSLVKENHDVKVYLKETPIFGSRSELSQLAADWAMEIFIKKGNLAYQSYHNSLWHAVKNNGNQLSNEIIKTQVEKAGLVFKRTPQFTSQTPQENIQLFSQLGFRGTPALIVMPTEGANTNNISVIAGADKDGLRKAIAKAQS